MTIDNMRSLGVPCLDVMTCQCGRRCIAPIGLDRNVDAEVPNDAFDLRMAEQYLHRAQVACLLIDDQCPASAAATKRRGAALPQDWMMSAR